MQRHVEKVIFCSLTFLLVLLGVAGCVLPTLPITETPGTVVPSTPSTPSLTPDSTMETPVPTGTESQLANTSWQLVAMGAPGAETPVVADIPITLDFGVTGEVTGFGGCNTYGGSYETEENLLIFGEIVNTLRACMDEGVTQQELHYLDALKLAGRFEITEESLTIWYDNENGLLRFVRATTPAAPIDATPVITPGATMTATETLTTTTASSRGLAMAAHSPTTNLSTVGCAIEALPETDLSHPHRFVWTEGKAVSAAGLFAHFHEGHEPDIRAWLAQQKETRM